MIFPLTSQAHGMLLGLHCLVGAELLNTLTNSSGCTVTFSAIAAIVCFVFSLPRTLRQMSWLGVFHAVTMGIAVLLAIIFSGVQSEPFKFTGEKPIVTVIPVKGTTYVMGTSLFQLSIHSCLRPCTGMSAFLNISYTFIGQIVLPSVVTCPLWPDQI